MRTPNDRLVARELAIERHPRSSQPDERMEPKGAQRNLVEQTNEIIVSFCMGHFVQQDRMELPLIEQSIDTHRKQNMRRQDAADRRRGMSVVEAHWDAICHKTRWHLPTGHSDRSFGGLPAYAGDQSHKHGQCAGYPYHGKHKRRPALRHAPHWVANDTERRRPSQMRRPKLIN